MNKRVFNALRKAADNGQQPAQAPKTMPDAGAQLTKGMRATILGGGLGLAYGKVRRPPVTLQERAGLDKIRDMYRRIYSIPSTATRPTYPGADSESPTIRHKAIRPPAAE